MVENSLLNICPHCNRIFKKRKYLTTHLWIINNKEHFKAQRKVYNENNSKKILEYAKNYSKIHSKENRERTQKWYQKDKDKILEKHKERYSNSEKVRQYMKEYYIKYSKTLEGKAIIKASQNNRRTREKGFSKITKEKINKVFSNNLEKYGVLTCELCFKPVDFNKYTLDHFIPIIRCKEFPNRDLNALDNLGIAHRSCNSKKRHLTLQEWLQKHLKLGGTKK